MTTERQKDQPAGPETETAPGEAKATVSDMTPSQGSPQADMEPGIQVEAAMEAEQPLDAEVLADFEEALTTPENDLATELADALRENAELRDQLLRALADVENTRRRAARDKEDTAKYAIAGFARDLLETADNLRRALDAVPADAKTGDAALSNLIEGVEATERQMLSVFAKNGLVKVDPVGEAFDPNYHQAVFEVPNSGQAPGTVAQVLQAGFVLNGRLVRPAMVGVAKGEPPPKVDTVA